MLVKSASSSQEYGSSDEDVDDYSSRRPMWFNNKGYSKNIGRGSYYVSISL